MTEPWLQRLNLTRQFSTRVKSKKPTKETSSNTLTNNKAHNVTSKRATRTKKTTTAAETRTAGVTLSKGQESALTASSPTVPSPPSSSPSPLPPGESLDQLQSLVDRLLTTNSSSAKREILAQSPAQAPLLAWVYDPQIQFYVKSNYLIKYAQQRARQRDEVMTEPAHASSPLSTVSTLSFLDYFEYQSNHEKTRARYMGHVYDTLPELLTALSSRTITGHSALDAILVLMVRFCHSVSSSSSLSLSLSMEERLETLFATPRSKLLFKILDKNLKTGCSIGMLQKVYPGLISEFHVALGQSLLSLDDARLLFEGSKDEGVREGVAGSGVTEKGTNKKGKKPSKSKDDKATGKGKGKVEDRIESALSESSCSSSGAKTGGGWFGSRKLDGVRCLIHIDRPTGEIKTLSRTGRAFESLNDIQEAIRTLVGRDEEQRKRFFERAIFEKRKERLVGGEGHEAIVLDGEICVFSSVGGITTGQESEGSSMTVMEVNDLGREDFTSAVSLARRSMVVPEEEDDDNVATPKGHQSTNIGTRTDPETDSAEGGLSDSSNAWRTSEWMSPPDSKRMVYCIFDCLTEKEFEERTGTRIFSERIRGIQRAIGDAPLIDSGNEETRLDGSIEAVQQARQQVRVLTQQKLESFADLETLVSLGLERGWEGVMIRRDVGYEGKRSRNLLKIKQFQDSEFKVEQVMVGRMRVPFQGEYQERDNLLTNVVVLHRGNRVRVGSGFSVQDRIRFGKDPSLILGKTITVQYFEESRTVASKANTKNGNGDGDGDRDGQVSSSDTNDDAVDNGVWSLRFPTVKAIYDAGPRQL
ncbi:hypothetical protein BGZ94_006737 [Podila epigama]|nr:hypothetical protein BGZ94_006737 [Podila epigama]